MIHFQTSTAATFRGREWTHPTLYNGCNYSSTLWLKLIRVSERGPYCAYIGSSNIHDHIMTWKPCPSLQWRHNERDCVSNHQSYDYSLNRLFTRRSMKTLKHRVTGICEGNSPVTHKGPVTRKMFPFDDVIMVTGSFRSATGYLWREGSKAAIKRCVHCSWSAQTVE